MPWSLVLLLGGGFALAKATQVSGLSAWMGSQLAVLDFLDARVLALIVIIGTSFATEVTSNVATCSILLPVLRDLVSGTFALRNFGCHFHIGVRGGKEARKRAQNGFLKRTRIKCSELHDHNAMKDQKMKRARDVIISIEPGDLYTPSFRIPKIRTFLR